MFFLINIQTSSVVYSTIILYSLFPFLFLRQIEADGNICYKARFEGMYTVSDDRRCTAVKSWRRYVILPVLVLFLHEIGYTFVCYIGEKT